MHPHVSQALARVFDANRQRQQDQREVISELGLHGLV
jgi:hypothetical protein